MLIARFVGHHVNQPGPPGLFRSLAGQTFLAGEVESRFSRKSETANLDAVRLQHNEALKGYDVRVEDTIFIVNNTEHIERLNEGWSAQTPPGFFEQSLQAAVDSIVGNWKIRDIP